MHLNGSFSLTKTATRFIVSALAVSALSLSLVACTPSVFNADPKPAVGESNSPSTPPVDETTAPPSDPQPDASDFAALEAFVASQQSAIPQVMSQFEGMYSDFRLEAEKPGTVVFTYVFANQIDSVTSAANFEKTAVPQLQAACDTQLFPAMRAGGIEGPLTVRYVYVNADGSTIWQRDFHS